MSPTPDATETAEFEAERPRLLGLAYRITGARTVAEDLVQETWIRWAAADRAAIRTGPAWLTTVLSRLALDHLRSARHDRERYVGPWLPELVAQDPSPDEHAELAESLTVGFLAVLERLGPTERVVFVLADVFGLPHAQVAAVVDRSEVNTRQIAARARARVRDERPRYAPTDDEAWAVTAAFLTAAQVGDLESLLTLLAPDAVAIGDGGAEHRAARRPVVAERIPRYIATLTQRVPADAQLEVCSLNGQPAIVVRDPSGRPRQAVVVAVADGRVQRLWAVVNPDKLTALDR